MYFIHFLWGHVVKLNKNLRNWLCLIGYVYICLCVGVGSAVVMMAICTGIAYMLGM